MATYSIGVWDYVVLAIMLVLSAFVGAYAAFTGGRQRTSAEYLLGDRKMGYVSVGLSIATTFSAATSLLGHPAEIYAYGTTFGWNLLGFAVGALFSCYTSMPLLYRLRITSIYTV